MAKFRKMQRDVQKLRKLNTSYRRKARRLKNLYGVELDEQVLYIDDFNSRKQFNDYVKRMEKVTSYSEHRYIKNKHGMVIKREVYQDYKRTVDQAQKIADQQKDKLLSLLEKQLGYTPDLENFRLMGDSRYDRFNIKYKFDNYGDEAYFEEHLDRLKKKLDPRYYYDSDRRLKYNFLESIDRSLGVIGKPLYNKINRMSIQDFVLFFYSSDVPLFEYVYSFEEAKAITTKISSMIDRFYKDLDE